LKCDSHTTVVSCSLYVQHTSFAVAIQLRLAVRADIRIWLNAPCPLPFPKVLSLTVCWGDNCLPKYITII